MGWGVEQEVGGGGRGGGGEGKGGWGEGEGNGGGVEGGEGQRMAERSRLDQVGQAGEKEKSIGVFFPTSA